MGIIIGSIIEMNHQNTQLLKKENRFIQRFLKFALLLFLLHIKAEAQDYTAKPISKSNSKVNINGKSFFVHKVEQGQTLYGISKAYQVAVSEIELYNDSLKLGLKAGMDLRIPIAVSEKASRIEFDQTGKFILHKVEKKQTLYAITKKYNVGIDAIQKANPEIEQGLKEGMVLKIPQKEIKSIEPPVAPILKEIKKDKEIREKPMGGVAVNLFLPFYLHQNDSIIRKESLVESDELFAKSVPGIEFLSGFQLACDSIISNGTGVAINVYDTPADSAASVSFFANKKFLPAELWLGPFHSHAASAAANAVKKTDALLVLPFSSPNKVLLGNEHVIKLSPSLPTGIENMSIQLMAKHKNVNFILVHNALNKELQIVDLIKKTFRSNSDSIKELVYKTAGLKGFTNALSFSKTNVVIVASSDQAFVTDLFNKLRGLHEKDYKIMVVGMESWINYENLDINTIQKLQLQIPAGSCINYHDTLTNKFIKAYRERFHTEPGKYAFSGYDAAMYFIPLIAKYGQGIINKLESNHKTGLSTHFSFRKTGDDSGFENNSIYLLKYEDYELKKQ